MSKTANLFEINSPKIPAITKQQRLRATRWLRFVIPSETSDIPALPGSRFSSFLPRQFRIVSKKIGFRKTKRRIALPPSMHTPLPQILSPRKKCAEKKQKYGIKISRIITLGIVIKHRYKILFRCIFSHVGCVQSKPDDCQSNLSQPENPFNLCIPAFFLLHLLTCSRIALIKKIVFDDAIECPNRILNSDFLSLIKGSGEIRNRYFIYFTFFLRNFCGYFRFKSKTIFFNFN